MDNEQIIVEYYKTNVFLSDDKVPARIRLCAPKLYGCTINAKYRTKEIACNLKTTTYIIYIIRKIF